MVAEADSNYATTARTGSQYQDGQLCTGVEQKKASLYPDTMYVDDSSLHPTCHVFKGALLRRVLDNMSFA